MFEFIINNLLNIAVFNAAVILIVQTTVLVYRHILRYQDLVRVEEAYYRLMPPPMPNQAVVPDFVDFTPQP